ncbi:hypothetical protein DRF68_12760 [Candidatus Chryseobacterium massiliae]|uniref:Uncharacterized protein n=1 Tax=Candidatus Chryseobacterium massiliense TaxID=204089 RepID=A0A3D9B3Y9_9FLAO|nr:hypothetical protein DRF68_12760 [Candidatus Chryseobacterium massiliae]
MDLRKLYISENYNCQNNKNLSEYLFIFRTIIVRDYASHYELKKIGLNLFRNKVLFNLKFDKILNKIRFIFSYDIDY